MIEMLGVLAIIGILSVAAIAGLTWAFAKYKANNTIHDVHLWELAALDSQQLYSMTSGQLVLNELGEVSTHGYPMAIMVQDENVFYISVDDVPKRVCSLTLDMVEEPMIVTVNGTSYTGNDICDTDTNQMLFYFNKYMGDVDNTCIPACPSGETCCNGVCREIETPCGSDGCLDCKSKYCTNSNTCCSNPNATKCGGNDCCEGNCCNGTCCPSGQVCGSDGNCACQNDMVLNPSTGLCECPADAPYYFENENMCCQSGYTPVEGVCQKVDCRGGPTSYDCYINDILCGYNCDVSARNCRFGICYADECALNETFTFLNWPYYYYYCKLSLEDISCYRYGVNDFYRCFKGGEYCMAVDANFNQLYGTCDLTDCQKILSSASLVYWGDKVTQYGSCDFGNNLLCYPIDNKTKWTCYKNGFRCGYGCLDPLHCGDCQEQSCLSGMVYNSETGYCEDPNTGVYCTTNIGAFFQDCYNKEGKRCSTFFAQEETPRSGSCTSNNCPTGYTYGYIEEINYYGCIQDNTETPIKCRYDFYSAPAVCYYKGNQCGAFCDFSGKNCQEVNLPQCAEAGHCPQTGYDMSDGCTCDGSVTRYNGKDYCCPTGHEYVNGACALL